MSDTTDITTGFVQMVEAYKVRPELEGKIKELEIQAEQRNHDLDDAQNVINDLRAKLASASEDKERLTRERDDAMFRTLELEEKAEKIGNLLTQLTGIVSPPAVEKDTASSSSNDRAQDQGSVSHDDRFGEVQPIKYPDYVAQHQSQDQSEASPTSQSNSQSSDSEASPNVSQGDASSSGTERHENHGKPYDQKPWWVNNNDWKSQGGLGPYANGSWEKPWDGEERHYG